MGMSAGGHGERAVPYINVTPLIDVLLVMIIIFMVVTPLKPSRFEAKIPSEPDPNQDLSQLKPNPLTLVVTISGDYKLKLNQDDMGNVSDTAPLSQRLVALFQQRKETRAFRPGTEDVEKTVFIKAPRGLKYGDVVKVIDAIKGAGANPVGLQVDDLAQ
ncbi:MAG TPA: biopolymer transporter ExbD [Pyrinomonadaceae bacterium]|jgi:biopolymer transport protein ExbD|nr:biopolymer transporter ExbD [Pyrinomonadaceae bacterium]